MAGRSQHGTSIVANFESFRRGGSTRTARCSCGWIGPQRSTIEMVEDDADVHRNTHREG